MKLSEFLEKLDKEYYITLFDENDYICNTKTSSIGMLPYVGRKIKKIESSASLEDYGTYFRITLEAEGVPKNDS